MRGGESVRVFRSRRVVTPDGVRAASIHVRDGVIDSVREYDDTDGAVFVDAGDAALLPGVIDTHVHVNEPGRSEWEGFATATAAAAAGGVTTIVDMPLNSVPATTSAEALRAKMDAARGRCRVDVGFWGGVVPGNAEALEALVEAGALGFKCFLVPSGVDEFAHVGEADLREALPRIAALGVPLLVHAELPGPIDAAVAAAATASRDTRCHPTWLETRPVAAEVEAAELLIRLCRETGARVHIVHVSAAELLPLLRGARAEGLPLGAETCPHYLTFADEEIADGETGFKCAPPIRGSANRDALWRALAEGDLDLIASDHSPCPPDLKSQDAGDFLEAWGGIASLELSLSAVWTGASARGHDLAAIARWMSAGPARLAGLARKGTLAPGRDADIVVFEPEATWRVDPRRLRQRHPVTPYAGRELRGRVRATYVRGEAALLDGELTGEPRGRFCLASEERWTSRI